MTPTSLTAVWQHLNSTPLLWLCITIAIYLLAIQIYKRAHNNPLLLPVLTSVIMLVILLLLSGTPYEEYFASVKMLHFLIGPATVALAIPLYHQLPKLKLLWWPLSVSLSIGALTGLVSSALITHLFGGSAEMLLSLLPKSATMPIALAITDYTGGEPSITAVAVAITGVLGSLMSMPVFRFFGFNNPIVQGIATGVSAHAIGTARLIQSNETKGAFSALAMCIAGILTAVFMPVMLLLLKVLHWL